ncbi:putative RNA helicase [Rosa chinensis]|uniref:ATP-dependent RNA helicase n=1 Tax=Rosa chinensis TaxID=74649 RepID=A0A2P6PYD6_ROSCH|nr:putative RNA helicase [Rosa chinensis]
MVTSLLYLLLREMKMNVREVHSRKPQLYRTRISEEFKESKQLILVTSDVSARGMNYSDVTLVIQVVFYLYSKVPELMFYCVQEGYSGPTLNVLTRLSVRWFKSSYWNYRAFQGTPFCCVASILYKKLSLCY